MASANEKPLPNPSSPSTILDDKVTVDNNEELLDEDLERRLNRARTLDKQIKHRVRILRVIQRSGSGIASILVLGVMINTYVKFNTHKTSNQNGQLIQVYPKMPILWPTYMMLATSAISLCFNLAVLTAYCVDCCRRDVTNKVKKANDIDGWHTKVGYLISATSFVVWLSTSTTFKMMQGPADSNPPPRDLFGFSCSNAADALVAKYRNSIVNFNIQCETQQASFSIGVLNAFLELLGLVVNILALRRLIHKRKLERLESHMSAGSIGKVFKGSE